MISNVLPTMTDGPSKENANTAAVFDGSNLAGDGNSAGGIVLSKPHASNGVRQAKVLAARGDDGRLPENLRVLLAIIAGLILLDISAEIRDSLTVAVFGFSLYAVLLLVKAGTGARWTERPVFIWLDASWFLIFLVLAGPYATRYFLFLFFPIYFAAWRFGKRESIFVATFCALASLIAINLAQPTISWGRLLSLPLSLFIVGPLGIAMASAQAARQRNQAFIMSIVEHIDSRDGFDTILPDVLGRICNQFNAQAAILAMRSNDGNERVFCWDIADGISELSSHGAGPLVKKALALPAKAGIVLNLKQRWWQRESLFAVDGGEPMDLEANGQQAIRELAALLDQPRLLSAPINGPGIGALRILIGSEWPPITQATLGLLLNVLEQIAPAVENAYLREQLLSETANLERSRIGRDLHDSALQPYIGLKFAIEAVHNRVSKDDPIAGDLAGIVEMVTAELSNMRDVISGLRGAAGQGGGLLASAIRRQAARFGQLFGIEVDVTIEGEMPVSRRIAGEIFHMVAEGLSNIRRHTPARKASISVTCSGLVLRLRIANECGPRVGDNGFLPRSLAERAKALSGELKIDYTPTHTAVIIDIPIASASK